MTGPVHGRDSTYVNYRCRCVPCIGAHADSAAYYKQRRYERTAANGGVAPAAVHNYATYCNWGCGCDTCRAANRAYWHQRRAAAS